MTTKICPSCLDDFTPRSKRHFYCSADCRSSSEFVRNMIARHMSQEEWRASRLAIIERLKVTA